MQMLSNNKESGFNYRERREADWLENYTLYRDKVTVNRLTQRQSVNIPIMKQTVRTLLKDVDDMPVLYYENLDNDKQKEVFINEYWKLIGDDNHNKFSLQDIVDKRQVFLFGRSFDQWQIVDGMIKQTVQDPQDMLVSRYCDPFDLNSSRFLIHTHIFKPLATLSQNPMYDQKKVKELQDYFSSEEGIIKSESNTEMRANKDAKMEAMGLSDVSDPILGETWVELSLHFVYQASEKEGVDEEIFLYVEAEDEVILMKKPLEDVIGETADHYWRNHYPYVSWADDLERQDFWSDGVGDIVRTPNIVLNSWFSQLVENRTLRNFGMHYYDSSDESFVPQTFNPVPWGWYPAPKGDINKTVMKVDVPDLSGSLEEVNFVIGVADKASGATATQQGVQTARKVTLGEVELALGEAKERVKGMSKFYTPAWKQRGQIFLKLIEAGGDKIDAVTIYKKGRNTSKIYSREIGPNDWKSKLGYQVKIWSQDEKDANDTEILQKLELANQRMPGNPKLIEVTNRKTLEFVDLPPDDINDIMEFEQQKMEMMNAQSMMGGGMPMQGLPPQQPLQQLPAQV